MNQRDIPDTITTTTLRFERLLDAPVDRIWQHLVDPELRARWFMGGPTELATGGRFGLAMHGETRLVLTHAGLRGRQDALDFGGGWHSHLAALERRIRRQGVPDFWALHADSRATVERLLE